MSSSVSLHAWSAASELDRVGHRRRSDAWVAGLWRAQDARLLELDDESRFTTDAQGTRLRMTTPAGSFDLERHRLLGLVDGAPVFAVRTLPEGEVHSLREIGGELSNVERDIAAAATAVLNWHSSEPLCPRCGGATRVTNGGYARFCEVCQEEHFPRTDPAVIVAITDDDDRLLLGRQASWGHRVSVLAGFVEAGESLEQTIHREVGEEVGITLGDLAYFGSQPWPFPRSLMTGFFARATSTVISVDADEIAWAGWFTRDDLDRQLAAGTLGLPGSSSIAHRLVEAWRTHALPW